MSKYTTATVAIFIASAVAQTNTGPEVGQRIPSFTLVDQTNRPRAFADLKGKKGLVLAIVRSADW